MAKDDLYALVETEIGGITSLPSPCLASSAWLSDVPNELAVLSDIDEKYYRRVRIRGRLEV